MRYLALFAALAAASAEFIGEKEAQAYKGYAEIFRQGEGLMEPYEVTERRLGLFSEKCRMHGNETQCPLGDMPTFESTIVESGGETRCIFDFGDPERIELRSKYQFQVVPGLYRDRVILFLQGGGGLCYDQNSTASLLCNSHISFEDPLRGLLNVTDALNPYYGYTTVIATHCSGDFHLGNVVRDYTNIFRKSSVVQYGQKNLESVIGWIAAQQASGALSSRLAELVIMGESGGSLAAQIWAPTILNAIPSTRARVLSDSMLGVFSSSLSMALRDLNGCNLLLTDSLQEQCKSGKLDYEDSLIATLKSFENQVPMLFTNSKNAVVQMSLYNMLHLSYGGSVENSITIEEWYDQANGLLKNLRSYNDASFWVTAYRHKFLATPYFERTSVYGTGTVPDLDTLMLSNWIRGLEEQNIACQQCSGKLADVENDELAYTRYCEIYLADQCAYFPAS